MTSIATPNNSGAFSLLAQTQGQMFESLKKQWEASSFDQLFQRTRLDRLESQPVSHDVPAADPNAEEQAQHQKGEGAPDFVLNVSNNEQTFENTQAMSSGPEYGSSSSELAKDQSGNILGGAQSIRRISNAFGESDGESSAKPVDAYASDFNVDTVDTAPQTVVVGIDGEKVRLWMRGSSTGLSKEQLISKIRAELSWAGMALDTFVLNGEKLVGIR